jgi:DNA-binding response OmpR family regulator
LPRLLVVDPDRELRRTIREACERDGHRVAEAASRRQALALCRSGRPSLVLLAPELADGSGLEACVELRRMDGRAAIVLVGSGRDPDGEEALAALEAGADDFVPRPLRPHELMARLDANLRRLEDAAGPARWQGCLRFEDLTIDVDERRALRDGLDVGLTETEFDLLALLARRAGAVLTREAALERIWGHSPAVDVETRVIDVHVRNLRRKIEAEPARPRRILAVPGIGYRFGLSGPPDLPRSLASPRRAAER